MMKILFTGGGGAGNEALWRLLGQKWDLHFGDAEIDAIDPIIPVSKRHKLLWASDPEFVPHITQLCQHIGIDVLVPTVDEELAVLASAREAFLPTKIMLPDYSYVTTMLDKFRMVEALANQGIRVPNTKLLSAGFKGVDFPCVVKPRKGRGSRGVRVVGENQARELLNSLGPESDNYVLQQLIGGTEYTVQMFADQNRELVAVVPARVDVKKGVTIKAETSAEKNVITACRRVHRALPASGCYNIQLMLTEECEVFPFEINPRPSTTFCLSVAAGIDPFAVFLGNSEEAYPLVFQAGMKLRRHWANHFADGDMI